MNSLLGTLTFTSIAYVPDVPTLSYQGPRHKSTETLFRGFEFAKCLELREVRMANAGAIVDSNARITPVNNAIGEFVACAPKNLAELTTPRYFIVTYN